MKTFYEAIYEWVADSFGQSEADDPSWNIKELADYLSRTDIDPNELNANTQYLCYDRLREHFLEEDIENVAENIQNFTLTPDKMAYIKSKYYKLEDATYEQLTHIMEDME